MERYDEVLGDDILLDGDSKLGSPKDTLASSSHQPRPDQPNDPTPDEARHCKMMTMQGIPDSPVVRASSPLPSVSRHSEDDDFEISFLPPPSAAGGGEDIDAKDIDSMVAQEMLKLSMEDREKVYYDVHGVSSPIQETPELIQNCLEQLDHELKQAEHDFPAYQAALSMDSAYVQNPKFRLMFLRADRMDPKLAAQRIGRHFQAKLELFGSELLVKDITQDDLDPETMKALYDGSGQTLPQRDRAGRLIIFAFLHQAEISVEAKLRRVFYRIMVQTEDEETQRMGCVGIGYLVGDRLTFATWAHRREWNSKLSTLMNALPIRYDAAHFCHDSLGWKSIFAFYKIAATMSTRVRIREHYGSQSECLFSLGTFGIPTSNFPLAEDGTRLIDAHIDSLSKRRVLERLRKPNQTKDKKRFVGTSIKGSNGNEPRQLARVGTPGRSDVLLGRGKACYQHVGNLRLRNWIECRSADYEAAGFRDKERISGEIVELVQESTGRFLKDDGAGWIEVEDSVAKKKVAHAFRTLRGNSRSIGAENKCTTTDGQGAGNPEIKGTKRNRSKQ